MLNVVVQRGGAHSETLPLFVELLDSDCSIFFPHGDEFTSYEPYIKSRYRVEFIKDIHRLYTVMADADAHGVLVFNTAAEMKEPWAETITSKWKGLTVAYHHEMQAFEVEDLLQAYAHPFIEPERYFLPVSDIFDGQQPAELCDSHVRTIILPNWTRPSQLQNKNLDLLSELTAIDALSDVRFVMTGMTLEIMNEAKSRLKSPARIDLMHRPNIRELGDLITSGVTFIMPLINPNGRYARQGLTGSIPLAINYLCPVIIHSKLAEVYQLDSFIDEADLVDSLPKSLECYNLQRGKVASARKDIKDKNKARFRKLLSRA